MKKNWFLTLTVILLLAACRGTERATPTPFPDRDETAEPNLDNTRPFSVTVAEVAQDPEAYDEAYLEISGRYKRRPLLVCDGDRHPSQATWLLLGDEESQIAVGGFDSQLRSLIPDGLTVTVTGIWQQWKGPVGCGKEAVPTQIWYLQADEILDPRPIARVTLTPTGGAGVITQGDNDADTTQTPAADGTPTPGDGSPPPVPTASPTPDAEGNLTPPTPTPSGGDLPTSTPTATSTRSENGSDTPTPDGTATPTAANGNGTGTPTPSATSANGTGTPTPNGGPGTPTATSPALSTATRDPDELSEIEFDTLGPEEPVLELLGQNEAHLYPLTFDFSGVITITAVAEPMSNIVLNVLDASDNVLHQANTGGPGQLETLENISLNVNNDYRIRVYDQNGNPGHYCLLFNEEGGFPDTIRGGISYGQTVNGQVEALGIDYWCFVGKNGDVVSVAVDSNNGDFVLALFGPPDFDALGDSLFEESEINNVTLQESGMFMIGVLDFDGLANNYSLRLTRN